MLDKHNSVILGQGSFGCVIKPSPKCEKELITIRNDNINDTVAKIYTSTDASIEKSITTEVDIAKTLAKWDTKNQYFVIPIKLCLNKRESLLPFNAFHKCEDIPLKQDNFKLLIMEYEGKDIIELLTSYKKKYQSKLPIKIWISLLNNILKGVEVLIKHEYIHQDIKPDNVTYSSSTNVLKLLDFGLSKSFSDVYTENNKRLKHYYFVYPFEYLLMNDYLFEKGYQKYSKDTNHYIFENSWNEYLYGFGYTSYINYIKYIPIDEIKNKTKKEIDLYLKNPENYYKHILNYKNKIDIYGIGMMCIDIDHYLDFSELTEIQKEKYKNFVRGLVDIHPNTRFTIQQALQVYKTLL